MPACRRLRPWLVAAVFALALLAGSRGWLTAADNPQGKTIAEVQTAGSRLRSPAQILNMVHTRAGKPYDQALVQEDVRRLQSTRWFTADGVRVLTTNESDGRVTVTFVVTELGNTVQEIVYHGAQHLSDGDLRTLTGLRKGDAMNPMANEVGRAAILRRYQDDGRYHATVELVEGNKPTDSRVVYNIVEGPVVKVAGVEFVGNVGAITGRLKTQITTKTAFAGAIGGKFNPMTIEMDRKALTEYYQALGYLAVKIEPEVRRSADQSRVTIVYHIVEGQQHRVSDKIISGNKSFETDKLMAVTELKPGERYDRRIAQRDLTRLRDYYGSRGHNVAVDEQWYEVEPGVVQVQYNVGNDRGVPDRVGRIIIDGNEITRDRVILNQLDLRPGQILEYPKLEEAQMRLARLGLFDMEEPPTVRDMPNELDTSFKDIHVRVKETRTGQIIFGGSVNSDAGLTGNISLNERNFDITRIPTSWDDFRYGRAFRGAGQELRLEAAPGTTFQRYSATFREPYLFDTPFGLTTSAYFYNRSFAEYNEDRYGGRVTIDRRLDSIWTASASTRVEGVNVRDVPAYAPWSIAKDAGNHFLLGLRAGITRDTRDSYVYPTKGSMFDAGFEQVLGDYTFPVGTAEFTQFFSTKYLAREDGSQRHVLGFRTQVAVAGTNAPVFERFYAGGIRSFRGFSFRGVGPYENTLAVGGTFSLLNSIEYQIPILPSEKMFWVAFVDHGTVESKFDIKDYRVSVGTGIRLSVPALGPLPLAFDLAFPVVKGPYDHRQLFSFSMGLFGSQR
ncbi:outer membrane protein assembly factor BamA [Gemmata sp. JC673]|uniref:Outer membrane protein assembly factor BamA n=1 Tax=Gemmata algarum TaxID=2975278 RepID=A0ABU5EYG1_9BACT|nr:outer membrane protein assembly factor BamA [Gemmata algarum]MDY3559984.1 outer membrane protein assembly factor BamA [Gemmata algarum]